MRPPSVVDLRASLLPHLQAPDHACHHTPTSVQLYLPQAHRVAGRGGAAAAPSASGISYGAEPVALVEVARQSRTRCNPPAAAVARQRGNTPRPRRQRGGNQFHRGAQLRQNVPRCQGLLPKPRALVRFRWGHRTGHPRAAKAGTSTFVRRTPFSAQDRSCARGKRRPAATPLRSSGVRVRKEIRVARPLAEAFAYVADFSNSAEWDPGIPEARMITDRPVRQGSEFEVVALFRGKRQRFHYVVTAFEAERRIVLRGEGEKARSVDEIKFEPAGADTRIVYVADIRLRGIARVAEPLLAPIMNRMADDALAGLKTVLDRPS